MTDRTIVRRYVKALLELALESKIEKKVNGDLVAFHKMLEEEAELRELLVDPRTPAASKKKALEKVLPEEIQELSRNFLLMVVERRRSELLPLVLDDFEALLREHQGIELAEVVSATKLDAEQKHELEEKLESITKKKVKLSTRVDPEVLGGLRIKMGSRLYDGTLKRQLEDLREDLLKLSLY